MSITYDDPFSALTIQRILDSLTEDLGSGDCTSTGMFEQDQTGRFRMIAREDGVICGLPVASILARQNHPEVKVTFLVQEGQWVEKGNVLLTMEGTLQNIFKIERVMLNFLQHLSGIASFTRRYVDIVVPYKLKILDTRKTTPLWRELEKYAVRIGGGTNHRMGLYDMILIKDNHIDASGGVRQALGKARKNNIAGKKIEIEVRTLDELRQALEEGGADIIMLDNMSPSEVREAVSLGKGKAMLEASGGINLTNLEEYAQTGVDAISVGALTHSVKAMDLSLVMEK